MSSPNVKRLLRSARECLGRREYLEALQYCKEVLVEDKACYEAYIFVGKAAFHLHEYGQAEAAYRRASDLDARNPLAWQGLAELFTETASWASAAESYSKLVQLADSATPEDPLRTKRPGFLRRYAEAAARGGLLAEAEAGWRALADAAAEAVEAAAAGKAGEAGAGAADADAAVEAAEGELLECLCRLADVQLAADSAEIEARVTLRLAAEAAGTAVATAEQAAALESSVRAAVEGEWAEEALELDADHASATLRRIIALRPPCPSIVPYYEAFLKRLRKYIQAAPPGSMDRHSRRAVLLAAAKATMEGRCGERAGGCCGPYPFEAALAMLEVEHEVMGAEDPSLDPANPSPTLEPPPLPLLLADCGRIAARLMHRFPWNPTAQLHNALSLRRRAALAGFDAPTPPAAGAGGPPAIVVRLPAATGAGAGGRRRQVTSLLLSALSRGGRAVSGWLAACELLLEEGAAEAALDAAKEGLKFVAHRDVVGKERLAGAGLLLRLLAGQALLRLRKLDEAQLLLEGLAHGVSEGHVASGELAGIPPTNVSQQAKRHLSHVAAARGDVAGCRQRYDELVGGQLMGRSAAPIEAWAHGELGMLLLRQGSAVEGARYHLQAALAALQPSLEATAASATSPSATALVALQQEAAAYQLHLAIALWIKGGGRLPPYTASAAAAGASAAATTTTAAAGAEGGDGTGGEGGSGADGVAPNLEPFRSECRDLLMGAAEISGPLQAAALTWLGHWYDRAAEPRDEPSARRCYQRALALDPTQAEAGEALVAALVAAGRAQTAQRLCEEMRARAAAVAAVATGGRAAELAGYALGAPSAFLVYPGLLPARALGGGGAATDGGGGGGAAGWALRCLARLQRDVGQSEAAVTSYQAALRLEPEDAELWEGLAASYQALGRHTAALKSYGRSLELSPGRLFSRLQAAALQYQMGNMPEALSNYRTALAAAPSNAAALMGCGEVLLAQAALAARMGAAGAAAAELAEAAALAETATRLYGNLQAGWKLLGDIRMQHAAVPTLATVAATRGLLPVPAGGAEGQAGRGGAVEAGLAAARDRLMQLRAARRSYATAVHIDPRVAGLWGDLGVSYHLQLELAGQHPELEREGELQRAAPAALRRRALGLARGGLRLAPASDWLWSCAGTIAAGAAAAAGSVPGDGTTAAGLVSEDAASMAAAAEFCFSRALQLNPRRAPVWAALGRLYAAHGDGGLASRCFDFGRSHEPTSIAVWEAMGDAALRRGGLAVPQGPAAAAFGGRGGVRGDPRVAAAWRDAADAYEHAQLLGGDVESRLGYVTGLLVLGGDGAAAEGSVLAAATKAAVMQPLQPAAHHARGLALEARGDPGAAVQAYRTALQLLHAEGLPLAGASIIAGLSPRPLVTSFDPRVGPTAAASVQLDLARALVAAGRASEAVQLYDRLRQEGAFRSEDFGARLAYGTALLQVDRTAEAQAQLSDLTEATTAPLSLRLSAAAALVRQHVAARRWDEAYGMVLAATADVPDEGLQGGSGRAAAAAASRLWLTVLAGLVSARAPELEPELLTAMRQWAVSRRDLDSAELECRAQELLCAKHRAAGATTPALRQAARAVHICPYDRAARSMLANAALAAGSPRHTAAAARTAPRERLPYSAATSAENAAPTLGSLAPPSLVPSAAAAHAASIAAAPAAAAAMGSVACGAGGGSGSGFRALLAAVREASARMRRVVHAQPESPTAWYLCALTELQHAIASGGQGRLYRSAAAAARAATARAKAELQALPTEPPAGVNPSGAPAPPRPVLPPALALVMAAQAARARAPAATDPRVTIARAQRAALADVAVRSLAILSECHLQLRNRTAAAGEQLAAAAKAAEEAIGIAASNGADATPANRQLARIYAVQGDFEAADAAYGQAVKAAASNLSGGAAAAPEVPQGTRRSYELLLLIERAAVRSVAGRTAEALELFAGVGPEQSPVASPSGRALTDVAATQRALLLLQLGEAEAALEAAASAGTASGPEVAGLRSAAHVVQAAAAMAHASLLMASDDGGGSGAGTGAAVGAVRKKYLLEARWAAREALKSLTTSCPAGPVGYRFPRGAAPPSVAAPGGALASLLLGMAESALGKLEAATEQMDQASRLWPHAACEPPGGFIFKALGTDPSGLPFSGSGSASGSGRGTRSGHGCGGKLPEAHEVHRRPWACGDIWTGMAAVVRARV